MTVTSATAAATTPPAATTTGPALGADFNMFLRLLTTQMQNQDPLDPMDTSQYTQQLAQYSQVEQSIQQTGVLKDILARLSVSDMAQASGLIGRTVELNGASSGLGADGAQWRWSLAKPAASLAATILDGDGNAIASPALSGTGGQLHWDGTLSGGGKAPPGTYTLAIAAKDEAGRAIAPSIHGGGRVDQVLNAPGGLQLDVSGQLVPAGSILGVRS